LHDDGRPDHRFVLSSSDAKVNFLEKEQRSDKLKSLECVTALSFFPAAWYFGQTMAHKLSVLIVATTVLKLSFHKNALAAHPSTKGTQTVVRTTVQQN
jgi:hypothetical protein